MPLKPLYEWEQTDDEVLLAVTIKGFKQDGVDIFLSDLWVKVNAPPTYLLQLDLLHPIDAAKSTHFFDPADRTCLRLRLRKAEPIAWASLCVDPSAYDAATLQARRAESARLAGDAYATRLRERVDIKEEEKRRMAEEQWEVEKAQRRLIEGRVKAERDAAEADLYAWEDTQRAMVVPASPADIIAPDSAKKKKENEKEEEKEKEEDDDDNAAAPQVRHAETVFVTVDFTPKIAALPTRSRGDEEYYRRSRYKPTRVEDSPMFWKERADKHYNMREWQSAADAYTESIKRDGAFLACVSNRAACFIRLFEYKRAIDDCTLALTMLSNTPASDLTQERYRHLMMKLHARRGAAHCWGGCYERGVEDLRVASAYSDPDDTDADVRHDFHLVEAYMAEHGLLEARDPLAVKMQLALSHYYNGEYAQAAAVYREVLDADPYEVRARNNLSAALLQMGQFAEALEEATRVMGFCQDVSEALSVPGALSTNLVDSDDDDDVEGDAADEMVRQRNAAARKVGERSGHVYALLKACVRGAAAHCGMKEYRKALELLERAVRITPYDDDLQDDYHRIAEKLRLETLVTASTARA